jgi:hypothetical protein
VPASRFEVAPSLRKALLRPLRGRIPCHCAFLCSKNRSSIPSSRRIQDDRIYSINKESRQQGNPVLRLTTVLRVTGIGRWITIDADRRRSIPGVESAAGNASRLEIAY